MELNAISRGRRQPQPTKETEHNTGVVPSFQGDLDSDVCTSFLLAAILPGSTEYRSQIFVFYC